MYSHVVMFRLRDPNTLDHAVQLLRSLEGNVASLRTIEVGTDDSPTDRSSQICLITRFDDRAGYEAYHQDPFPHRSCDTKSLRAFHNIAQGSPQHR